MSYTHWALTMKCGNWDGLISAWQKWKLGSSHWLPLARMSRKYWENFHQEWLRCEWWCLQDDMPISVCLVPAPAGGVGSSTRSILRLALLAVWRAVHYLLAFRRIRILCCVFHFYTNLARCSFLLPLFRSWRNEDRRVKELDQYHSQKTTMWIVLWFQI